MKDDTAETYEWRQQSLITCQALKRKRENDQIKRRAQEAKPNQKQPCYYTSQLK